MSHDWLFNARINIHLLDRELECVGVELEHGDGSIAALSVSPTDRAVTFVTQVSHQYFHPDLTEADVPDLHRCVSQAVASLGSTAHGIEVRVVSFLPDHKASDPC